MNDFVRDKGTGSTKRTSSKRNHGDAGHDNGVNGPGLGSGSAGSALESHVALQLLNLKPLRDLAQNFDIDIASCLNEYLAELEREAPTSASLQLNQDRASVTTSDSDSTADNNAPPNFAQAALLLQNSSGVYSRKVEYLYSLVYQNLTALSLLDIGGSGSIKHNRMSNNNPHTNGKKSKKSDSDIQEFAQFDSDLQFLLLDDVLPIDNTGNAINLKLTNEKGDGSNNGGRNSMNTLNQSLFQNNSSSNNNMNDPNSSLNMTHLSIGNVNMDNSIISPTNGNTTTSTTTTMHEQNKALTEFLLNFGQMSSSATTSGGGDATSATANHNLRLMNGMCHVHTNTGALLMPGTLLENQIEQNNNISKNINHGQDINVDMNQLDTEEEEKEGEHFDNGDYYGGDDGDDDNEGNGFVLNSPTPSNNENDTQTSNIHQVQTNATPIIRNGTPNQTNNNNNNNVDMNNSIENDPWKMLDPHDNQTSKSRPIKIGISYKLPSECNELPSDSVTGARTKQIPKEAVLNDNDENDRKDKVEKKKKRAGGGMDSDYNKEEFENVKCIATQSYHATIAYIKDWQQQHQQKLRNENNTDEVLDDNGIFFPSSTTPPSVTMNPFPLKGYSFGNEFDYVAKAQLKHKSIEKRRKNMLLRKKNSTSAADAIVNERFREKYEGDDDDDDEINNNDNYDECLNDDYGGGGGYDDDDYDKVGEGDHHATVRNTTLHDFDVVFANNCGRHDDDENGYGVDGTNDNATFEDLCRAHLREFAKGAEKYAVESQLSKRVADWQSKLSDILTEEEDRPAFNITSYTDQILTSVQKGVLQNKSKSGSIGNLFGNDDITTDIVDFASITKHQDPFDVSRTFLASLMLCNTENITFCGNQTDGVSKPERLQVKLLKADYDSPMENYLAPSLLNTMQS